MLADATVVTNLEGRGIDETDAATGAKAVLEIDTQREQRVGYPLNETLVARQLRKLRLPIATDLLLVKVLEVAVRLAVETHQNRLRSLSLSERRRLRCCTP